MRSGEESQHRGYYRPIHLEKTDDGDDGVDDGRVEANEEGKER